TRQYACSTERNARIYRVHRRERGGNREIGTANVEVVGNYRFDTGRWLVQMCLTQGLAKPVYVDDKIRFWEGDSCSDIRSCDGWDKSNKPLMRRRRDIACWELRWKTSLNLPAPRWRRHSPSARLSLSWSIRAFCRGTN